MTRIRVLVVDDSLTVRKRIVEVLAADPGLEVVGEAASGRHAIELCRALHPDVITLDMVMPDLTGVAMTEQIMAHMPTPILIVSAATNRGELMRTYDALAAGAVEVLDKPSGEEHTNEQWAQELVATVKLVARIKVITHLRGRLRGRVEPTPSPPVIDAPGARLIALGASTGGPAAIASILRALPAAFPLPVLVVVHIGTLFGATFAEWLDGVSPLRVRLARDGDRLPGVGEPGVFVAPPDRHLVVREQQLRLSDNPPRHSCRPSVDVLFESLAHEMRGDAAGFLLTGMGRDGAAGLLAMRQTGAHTFAQDEATCAVFGMPREAIVRGAAERVIPLHQVAAAMRDLAAWVPIGTRVS